jgi:hypothetical protein
MMKLQFAVDQRLQGRSSWLKVVREKTEASGAAAKALP